MKKTKKEILRKLLDDTTEDKLDWDISIERDMVKATYYMNITDSKKIQTKIVYFTNHPKSTKLTILFEIQNKSKTIKTLIEEMGGKSKKNEVKEISALLNKILLKEEEKMK